MSKFFYILDPGHGGINPDTGNYVTPGKRSPKFEDGSVLYEGVNNRINVKLLESKLTLEGIECINLVDTYLDIPLRDRVKTINNLCKERDCVVISIHSDAFGNGTTWESPSGISVFTSVGQTESDKFANLAIQELICQFEDDVKWRLDYSDGDSDKEAQFFILRKTACPAILVEGGFHTNKEEATKMQTPEWRDKLTTALVDAIKLWEFKHEKN